MLHHIDGFVVTCAALSNLKPKLIQKKSYWDHSCFFFFVASFCFAFNHVSAKKISQLDFFWINFLFKCDITGKPKKKFFFQNEHVGDFSRVIAGKEIIFLNLISSIELWCEQKEAMFQEIFLPSWGLMTGEKYLLKHSLLNALLFSVPFLYIIPFFIYF